MNWLRSLRLRLLLASAVSVLLALLLTGIFIIQSFSASIDATRRDDLETTLDRLTAAIDPDTGELAAESPLVDPRYDTPLGGLYWQVLDQTTGVVTRSRSLWDTELNDVPASPQGTVSEVNGPGNKALVVLSRSITTEGEAGERRYVVTVAEAMDQDDAPIRSFNTDLVLALGVLALVLVGFAMLQVRFGLSPLETLRRQIEAIRTGSTNRLPVEGPVELQPVIGQINELLEAQEGSIAFSRERASDLAHGLKTPLAVLSATADRLHKEGDNSNGDLLQMLVDQMNGRIEYQLRIARLRYRTRAQGERASLNEVVLRSVAVLRRTHEGERLNWSVDLEEDLRVDIDEHDLMELGGIVLENASKWAASRVQVSCSAHDETGELVVEDDGIGISDEEISKLGVRGTRLDETTPGQGLGLAIAYEILRLNRGRIEVSRSRLGGLRVSICIPRA